METKTIKILAIDDIQDNLITLKALISESFKNVNVFTALNGKKGIEIAALENPDVILLDIIMPEMDGYEVCEILKADINLKDIPVIFITALKGDKASRIKALEVGAEAFLAKPIDESELIAQINAMVKIKEANFEKQNKEKLLIELVAEKTKKLEESNKNTLKLLEHLNKENEARKQSEQAVIESEIKYSKAFQTSPYCITITKLNDGTFVDINEAFCYTTGYSKEEVIGNTVENIQIWFNLDDRKQFVDNILANEKIENYLGYFKKKNGEKIIGLFSAQLIEIKGVQHILASINDITEQKLAEEALVKSKEQYQELITKIPDGVYVLRSKPDGSFMFEYVSPKMEEITQIKAQSILENPANAFLNFHPDDLQFLIQANIDGIASKKPALIVGRLLIKEKIKWVEISSNPEIQADGDILWHGLIADITEQKLAEIELNNTHQKLEVLMDAIPDLLFEVDFDGTIYNYHTNNNDLLVDSPDNFLGKKFVDILPEHASKVCQLAIIEASEKGISTGKQYSLQLPQGELWFDISVAPIKNIEDQISRFVILARDVTEQKKSVLELVKLSRTQALNSQINDLIIRIHDKMKLFEEVCEIASTYGNFRMSWVSQINEQTKVISPLVWYGHEEGYLKEIQKISIENNLFGKGPTGIAFREGKVSVCNNIATDPKMELWREEAIKRGYLSSIALPIIVREKVIGTFNLYAGEVDAFAIEEEVQLLENITANIAFSLEKILDEEERLIAEQKVREKDKEFGKLSANVSDLLYQFTRRPDGTYFVPIASAGIINIFGCKPEDVVDNFDAISAVLYPEDAERVINEIEYSATNLTYFTCEFRVQIPGKPIQWIYSKSNPEKLADGSVTWYGFNTDITERKNAEELLFRNTQLLEESQKITKVGGWELDLISNELYWTAETYRIHETSPQEFNPTVEAGVGYFLPESKQIISEALDNAMNLGVGYDLYLETYTTKGSIIHVRTTCVVTIEDGKPIKLTGIFQDITEQKLAEQEILMAKEKAEESENKLKVMVSAMPDLVWFKSQDGVYLECNQRFENFIGFSQEQLIGKTDYDLFDKDLADFFRKNDKIAMNAGKSTINEEEITFANDGHKEFLETIKTPIYDTNKNVIGVLGIGRNITDRKQAELEKENAISTIRKLSVAIEQSPVTTVITDLDGKIVFVNPKFTETTGYTFEEAKGQNPRILNTGYTSKSKYKDLWQTILAGNNWQGEFKNKKKNGEFFWERATISPVKNEAGEITNFLAVKEDITLQKIAEHAFKKNVRELEDYKFAIDESAIVSITGNNGIITYANQNFSKICKYSNDELVGSNHRIVNSGYHPKEYFANMWNTITNGKVWVGELRNKAKDGSFYWVHGTIIPFLDLENKPFRYLSIRFDITERKKAEERILESNERYNLVAKATNDSIWDLNILTHEIVRSGNGFEVLFGYKASDGNIDYPNYRNLIHPDDLDRVKASKTKVFDNPNEFNWEQDYRFLKANGEYAFVHDKGFIIRDEKGKAIRMIGATQDVTEREKHIKAIEEQNSKLKDIAWLQSHVVRAPLSRMMGIVNLLKEVELNSEEFKEWVGHFNTSSAELDKVIHDISNKSEEFDLKFKK